MKSRDTLDLLLLAAIWGASFLLMRLAVPAFGPVALAFVRVAGAALMLLPLLMLRGEWDALKQHWKLALLVGVTNSALPFVLFGFATLSITAGLAAIFNAATPLASALLAWAWLREPMTRWRLLGLGLEVEPLRTDPYTGRLFCFFSDPDGLPIELYEHS